MICFDYPADCAAITQVLIKEKVLTQFMQECEAGFICESNIVERYCDCSWLQDMHTVE